MNTQTHRLIFNKSRGCLMAVGEHAHSGGGGCSGTRRSKRRCTAANGLTYARQWNLRPGIALSAEQMAQLTSDMVWLVNQDVTLADGSVQSVLVPQVYVRVQPGDLDGSGALIAGKDVNMNLTGDLTNNGGTIMANVAGRNVMSLTAQNIHNLAGTLTADTLTANARQDLNNITSTTQSSATSNGLNNYSQTSIDRVAGLYVKGNAGALVASAGRDMNLTGAVISNAGTGNTTLSAGRDLSLNAITTASSQTLVWDANNRLSQSQDVGSQISAGGALSLAAGQDLNAKAAQVNATGSLTATAGQQININAGQAIQSLDEAHQHTSSGFLSSTTRTSQLSNASTTALASTFEGQSVNIHAGQDLSVKGSNILADQSVALSAGAGVSITAAQNSSTSSNFNQTTTSGLMGGGGIGFTVGNRMQSADQKGQSTTAAQSTIGSTGGNVTITAGQTYTQTGSDVLTPAGDIAIAAKSVTINDARETGSQSTEQKFKQSGLTVALSGGIIDTAQAALQGVQGATGSGSDRNKALNALIAYGKGSDLIEQGKAVGNAANQNGILGSDGNPGAAAASGIKISISLGASSSQSNSSSTTDTAAGSTVKAGGNVNIRATGQGTGEGDLTVQGSKVQAASNTTLSAAQNVNILASADTETNRSDNKSSSTSVGVSFGVGAGSAGFSLDIAASRGKGQANSDSTTYSNSLIAAGKQVSISSGADTNLLGGNIKGEQVTANVGGNLNIQSLQDTATSNASQSTSGVALSIPIGAGTGSASISQSKQGSNSNYQSVGEQSGIHAGAGGFQISVAGNTDLKGAVIASSADASKNSLSTGTLTTSDISNTLSASASSSGMSVGTNMLSGKYELGKAVVGNLLNNGSAGQSDTSTTKTAISVATLTVGNKTTDTGKEVLSDSNGKGVSTDTSNTNRTLVKADVAGLQKTAQDQQAGNNLLFKAATAVSDPINKAMTADRKIVLQTCQSDGQCEQKRVNAEDVKVGSDGKVYVFNNGIMNTEQQALDNAAKQSSAQANSQGVYVIINPHTGNVVSEIVYAGVDKLNEIAGAVLPISNASQANIDVRNAVQAQGGKVLEVDHSRGSLTSSNATAEQINQGTTNAAIDTVTFNGAAANAPRMADRVNTVTGGAGTVQQATHKDDKIGTFIGGNAQTGGRDASVGDAHTNYGPGVPQRDKDRVWGNGVGSVPVVVQPTNSQGGAK